jgi:hypothetical protein
MKHFDIPDEAVWGALGWLFLTLLNSVRRWQKDRVENAVWRTSLLTKTEHAQICSVNQSEIKSTLEKIDGKLDEQNTTMATNHKENRTDIVALAKSVAVLEAKGGH